MIPPPGAVLLFPGSSQPPVRFQPQNTILSSHAPQKAWLLSFSYCGGICRQSPISAHTPLVGRDNAEHDALFDVLISTHTPLAGRDSKILYTLPSYRLNQGVDKNWGYSVSFIFSVI